MGRPLALVIVVILAAGCATRASYHRLGADVAALRSEVTDLRQSQENTAREVARATAETRSLDARLNELNTAHKEAVAEVATLRGRVETGENEIRDARLAAVPPAASTPPPATARPLTPATPPPAAERPREPPARAQSPEQAYQAALATFRSREYGQAVLDFLDFIAKYPGHPLAANAQYWIGEAYYVQRDYRQALTEFQKVIDAAPSSPKVPDALLKMGLCYRSLRDDNHARQLWDRVDKDYPKSEAATKARALLRSRGATVRR